DPTPCSPDRTSPPREADATLDRTRVRPPRPHRLGRSVPAVQANAGRAPVLQPGARLLGNQSLRGREGRVARSGALLLGRAHLRRALGLRAGATWNAPRGTSRDGPRDVECNLADHHRPAGKSAPS